MAFFFFFLGLNGKDCTYNKAYFSPFVLVQLHINKRFYGICEFCISICEISWQCCGFVGFCFVFVFCEPLIYWFVFLRELFGCVYLGFGFMFMFMFLLVSFKCYLKKLF